jgi:hypothetical protein
LLHSVNYQEKGTGKFKGKKKGKGKKGKSGKGKKGKSKGKGGEFYIRPESPTSAPQDDDNMDDDE